VTNIHPAGVKFDFVEKYVQDHEGQPTVVFARNLDSVHALADRLTKAGHRVAVITGSMSSQAKDNAKRSFNPETGEASADVLISSDAGAVGANLQRGHHLINVDVPLTSMVHEQRIAREVRTGQLNHVNVTDLVTDSDFDRRNRQRLERKSQLRQLMTSSADLTDDHGLAQRIAKARASVFEKESESK
jgi:superfamily II DNA/RNA helicase